MKSIVASAFAMIICIAASAATSGRAVVNRWSISAGRMLLADHSLSDMQYKGLTIGIHGNHGTFFRNSTRWSWEIFDKIAASPMLINPARTNLINSYSLLAGYGVHCNFRVAENFRIKLGPALEASGGWKASPKYMNNSLSVDASLQLALSGGISYRFDFPSWSLSTGWTGAVPCAGLMFVPGYGMTAAQVVWRNAWADAIHFSSFHNNQAIRGSLWLDFHLRYVSLRLAMMHDHHWWHSGGIQFYTKSLGVQVGVIVEIVLRNRTASKSPYFD